MIMWLNHLYMDQDIYFDRKCRTRICVGIIMIVLGAAAVLVSANADHIPVMYMSSEYNEYMSGFFWGTGFGLALGGTIQIIRNVRYLKDEKVRKKRVIEANDERNRLLGLRVWAYSGYTMFFLLYIGMLIGCFISHIVVMALGCVIGVFAAMLLVYKLLLSKLM